MENKKCRSFLYHSKNDTRTSIDTSCLLYKMAENSSGVHEKYAEFVENTTIIGCEETCTQNADCDSVIYNNHSRYYYFKKFIFKESEITTKKDSLILHKNGKIGMHNVRLMNMYPIKFSTEF